MQLDLTKFGYVRSGTKHNVKATYDILGNSDRNSHINSLPHSADL